MPSIYSGFVYTCSRRSRLAGPEQDCGRGGALVCLGTACRCATTAAWEEDLEGGGWIGRSGRYLSDQLTWSWALGRLVLVLVLLLGCWAAGLLGRRAHE